MEEEIRAESSVQDRHRIVCGCRFRMKLDFGTRHIYVPPSAAPSAGARVRDIALVGVGGLYEQGYNASCIVHVCYRSNLGVARRAAFSKIFFLIYVGIVSPHTTCMCLYSISTRSLPPSCF
jgi:hypothetical protein